MVKIKIKNGELKLYINFLQNLNLKSRASRGRTKVIKLLEKKIDEYNADIADIRDDFFKKDADGNFVQKYGSLVVKDGLTTNDAQKEADKLAKEDAVIILDEYENQVSALYQALDEYDDTLSGVDATIYDNFMDKLENAKAAQ